MLVIGTAVSVFAQGAPAPSPASPSPTGAPGAAAPLAPADDPLSADARDAILAEETKAIRGVAADADGFIDRMQTWQSASETVQGFSAGLEDLRPVLDQLGDLRLMGQMGLFDLLAQDDADMAEIVALLDGLVTAVEVVDTLDELSGPLATLGARVEGLLARPTLTEAELGALRSSLPEGAGALERAATEYQSLKPTLDDAFQKLDEVEAEVRSAMSQFGPMLGTDAGRQLTALVDMAFDETRALKTGLDDMATSVENDIATLGAIESAIVEAEAHLAFARADALVAVDLAAARDAFAALVDDFPNTSWAEKARARLDAGVESEATAAMQHPASDDGATAMWIGGGFLLFGLLVCIGLVVHARVSGRNLDAANGSDDATEPGSDGGGRRARGRKDRRNNPRS